MAKKAKTTPVALVARDYIIFADGTRLNKNDPIPPDLAKTLPASFKKDAE